MLHTAGPGCTTATTTTGLLGHGGKASGPGRRTTHPATAAAAAAARNLRCRHAPQHSRVAQRAGLLLAVAAAAGGRGAGGAGQAGRAGGAQRAPQAQAAPWAGGGAASRAIPGSGKGGRVEGRGGGSVGWRSSPHRTRTSGWTGGAPFVCASSSQNGGVGMGESVAPHHASAHSTARSAPTAHEHREQYATRHGSSGHAVLM